MISILARLATTVTSDVLYRKILAAQLLLWPHHTDRRAIDAAIVSRGDAEARRGRVEMVDDATPCEPIGVSCLVPSVSMGVGSGQTD